MSATTGIVLCGGRSTRMGRPKAWLGWFGRTLVEHVTLRLAEAVDEVIVVTSEALDLPALEARVVRDTEPERGPLAGLRDGLTAASGEWAFVTATDAPFVMPDYVKDLLAHRAPVAPRDAGHVQVLSAVYPTAAAAQVSALLEAGAGRPLDLLERLGFRALDGQAFVDPKPWTGFNTPAAYLDAARRVRGDAVAEVELLGRAALGASTTRFRVPIGTLGEVLAALPDGRGAALVEGDRLARAHLASLGGRELVRDLGLPVGPGERVHVLDAQAGG